MDIKSILYEKPHKEAKINWNDFINRWSKILTERELARIKKKHSLTDYERNLHDKTYNERNLLSYRYNRYLNKYIGELSNKYNISVEELKKKFNEEVVSRWKMRLLTEIQNFGGKTESGRGIVMDIYKSRFKDKWMDLNSMLKFLDQIYSEQRFFDTRESMKLVLKGELEKVKRDFNLENIDNYRATQWLQTLRRDIKDIGRRPFSAILGILPFFGLPHLLSNFAIDGMLYKWYEQGKLSKDDIIDYLAGEKKLSDLLSKTSGTDEIRRKIEDLWLRRPLLLGDLTKEEIEWMQKKEPKELEKIKKDTQNWLEAKRMLETQSHLASVDKFQMEMLLKLLPFAWETVSDFVGYDIYGRVLGSIRRNLVKSVGMLKLPEVVPITRDFKTLGEFVKAKAKIPELEKKMVAIEKKIEGEALKYEKNILKNVRRSIKRQVETAEVVPIFEYVAKKKADALEIAKTYRAIEMIDNKIDDIYKKIDEVVGTRIKDYDTLANYLISEQLPAGTKKNLDKYIKEFNVLIRLRDNYGSKFLNLVSSKPSEIMSAAKLAGRNPEMLEGRALAVEIQRLLNMYIGEPAGSPMVKSLYRMYNPQELRNIHALRDKILDEVVKSPTTYKDIVTASAEHIGLSGVMAKLWNENKVFRESVARLLSKGYKVSDVFLSGLYSFISPYNYTRDKEAYKIINFVINSSLLGETFLAHKIKEVEKLYAKIGIKMGSEESKLLSKLLYFYKDWKEVPVAVQSKYPQLEEAFKFFRKQYDILAYTQHFVNNKWLGYADRIEAYHRINWSHTVLRENVALRKAYLESLKDLTTEEKKELNLLHRILGVLDVGDFDKISKLAPYVPASVFQPHLKRRTLQALIDIERDVFEKSLKYPDIYKSMVFDVPAEVMYYDYLSNFSKLMFEQPALQYYRLVSDRIKDGFSKMYVNWFMRNFYGIHRSRYDNLSLTLSLMEYLMTIGFNIRTALINLTQNLNTYIELGPNSRKYMDEALGAILSKNELYQKAMRYFPYYGQLQGLKAIFSEEPVSGTLTDIAFFLMSKTEYANRMMAYISGFVKAYREGAKMPEVAELLKKGFTLEEAAAKFGADVMKSTQFIYGRGGMPKLLQDTTLRPLTIYLSYPIKEVEKFIDWTKKEPVKLLSYLLLANELNNRFEMLGIDMANAFTLGVDLDSLYRAAVSLGTGKPWEASIYSRLALSYEWGGGGVIQIGGIPGVDILVRSINTAKKLWGKNIGFDDLISFNLQFSRMADIYRALSEGVKTTQRVVMEPIPEKDFIDLRNVDRYGFDFWVDNGIFYTLRRGDSKRGYLLNIDELLGYLVGVYPVTIRKVRMVDKFAKTLDEERIAVRRGIVDIWTDMIRLTQEGRSTADMDKIKKINEDMEKKKDEFDAMMIIYYLMMPDKGDREALKNALRDVGRVDVLVVKDMLKKAKESIFAGKVRGGMVVDVLKMMKEDMLGVLDIPEDDINKISYELDLLISEPVSEQDKSSIDIMKKVEEYPLLKQFIDRLQGL